MNKELLEMLKREGYYNVKEIPGRGLCGLREFITTIGLVEGLTESGYSGRYCYPKNRIYVTIVALETWDGKDDPIGNWLVYKGERGEYRNPKREEE